MNLVIGSSAPLWLAPLVNFFAVCLGAGLAWFASMRMERIKQRKLDLGLAYSLVFKVQELAEESIQLEKKVFESYSVAEAHGVVGPAWTKLSNIVGFNREIESISSEELALIAKAKDHSLVMDVREMESGHRIVKQVIEEIMSLRSKIEAHQLDRIVNGQVISFGANEEQHAQIAPYLIGLEALSANFEKLVSEVSGHAQDTAKRLGPFLKDAYKFEHFVSLDFPAKTENMGGNQIAE